MTGAETANETLEPREALATISDTVQLEQALRSRTEGVTWMIWGLVFAGYELSFDAAAWLVRPDPFPALVGWVMWLPWVLAGTLVTIALWRTAAVSAPALEERRPAGWLVTAAWVVFVGAAWQGSFLLLVEPLGLPGTPETLGSIVIGLAWVLLGVLDPFGVTERGRHVTEVIGLTMIVAGVLVAGLLPHEASAYTNRVATLAIVTVGGLAPVLGGYWQAVRG